MPVQRRCPGAFLLCSGWRRSPAERGAGAGFSVQCPPFPSVQRVRISPAPGGRDPRPGELLLTGRPARPPSQGLKPHVGPWGPTRAVKPPLRERRKPPSGAGTPRLLTGARRLPAAGRGARRPLLPSLPASLTPRGGRAALTRRLLRFSGAPPAGANPLSLPPGIRGGGRPGGTLWGEAAPWGARRRRAVSGHCPPQPAGPGGSPPLPGFGSLSLLRPPVLWSRFHGGPACVGAQRLKWRSCEVRLAEAGSGGAGPGRPSLPALPRRRGRALASAGGRRGPSPRVSLGGRGAGLSGVLGWWLTLGHAARAAWLVSQSGCPCPLSRSCRPGEKAAPRIISRVRSCRWPLSRSRKGWGMPQVQKYAIWCYTPLRLALFLSEALGDSWFWVHTSAYWCDSENVVWFHRVDL